MSQCQFMINFNCVICQLEIQADEYYYGDNSDRQEEEFYIWILDNIKNRCMFEF